MDPGRPLSRWLMLIVLLWCGFGRAHGINSHVHVTGWTLENLPPGPLADFFAEPAVFDALLLGATFPDSGYAVDDDYGELAHWSPFAEGALADLQARYPLPWDTLEARKHAAFVMGIALHGLQDELFDTLFLRQAEHHDGATQDDTDGGLDGIMFTEGLFRFLPEYYVPAQALSEVFASANGHQVTPQTIETGVTRVKLVVIDTFAGIGPTLDAESRENLTWSIAHYLDPAVPGSFVSEIAATEAFLEGLWNRLHRIEGPSVPVVHVYPEAPRRLRSTVPDGVDHWISLVLAGGVRAGSLSEDRVRLVAPDGQAVPIRLRPSRWAHADTASTRMIVLEPLEALAFDTEYRVEVSPGLGFLSGFEYAPWSYTVRTACPLEAPCPAPDIAVPSITGPADAMVPDANIVPDAALPPPDRGIAPPDRGTAAPDGGTRPTVQSTRMDPPVEGGCVATGSQTAPPGWLLLLLCLTRRLSRRPNGPRRPHQAL